MAHIRHTEPGIYTFCDSKNILYQISLPHGTGFTKANVRLISSKPFWVPKYHTWTNLMKEIYFLEFLSSYTWERFTKNYTRQGKGNNMKRFYQGNQKWHVLQANRNQWLLRFMELKLI